MLQIVFDNREGVRRLGDNLLQFFLQREQAGQRKEELKQKQAEFKFNQEQQQAEGKNALAQLFGQALGGGLQSPAAQNVVGQAGNANVPTTQLQVQAPGALEFEQTARATGARDRARAAALNAAPARSRPLLQAGFDLQAAGQDASVTNTLLDELSADLDPSEAEQLQRVRDRLADDKSRLDLNNAIRRKSSAAELRLEFPGLANLPDEEVIDVAAAVSKELQTPDKTPSEIAFDIFTDVRTRRQLDLRNRPIPLFSLNESFDLSEEAVRAFIDPEFTIESFSDRQRSELTVITGLDPILSLSKDQIIADLGRVTNAVTRLMSTDFPGLPPKARVEIFKQQVKETFRGDQNRRDRDRILKTIKEAEDAFVPQR